MANHKSAKKAYLISEKKADINASAKSKMKTLVKKFYLSIDAKEGDKNKADQLLRDAESHIMKIARRGIIKLNPARTKVSRMARDFKKAYERNSVAA